MDEQNTYNQLDGTTNEMEYIDRSNEKELFYDSLLDSAVGHIKDCDNQVIPTIGRSSEERVTVHVDTSGICRPKRRSCGAQKVSEKTTTVENMLLQRLEKARAKARSRDD